MIHDVRFETNHLLGMRGYLSQEIRSNFSLHPALRTLLCVEHGKNNDPMLF